MHCISSQVFSKQTQHSTLRPIIAIVITLRKDDKEVALFYADVKAGLWNSSGSVWLYDNSYLLPLGQKVLPGIAVEDVFLRGRS